MIPRKPPVSPDSALASDIFDQFCSASTLKSILYHHRHLCDVLKIKPTNFSQFYPKLKAKLGNWRAQALWNKFDKRAGCKCYNRSKACSQNKVLIIGAGPCGLRAAIEAQLLGARVVVVEKRDRITRNNVLHLWPFVIQDLKGLGAKKFFGKFCAGSIDHISIRQLQCILLKVALILGVEIHEGVSFDALVPPPADQNNEKIGWRASVTPHDHPVSHYEFDVLIGADGKRNTLEGFRRKEFRGKLAIAITANFINRRTEAEAMVEEISGVAFIFNQKFFKDLYADTRIDLENIVYYKDDTHYFVMTAKKHSLIDKGVILHDCPDTAKLLDPSNVDRDALLKYAKEAADFSTNYMLPELDFAVNHYGQPDVAMFDFTSMYAAENASRVVERNGHKLLQLLVGDSLLEPFWPTGSGCARGFLSSMDACWAIRSWATNGVLSPLDVIAERESVYRLLAQTTPENLQKDLVNYTLDPHSRYPNLNARCVLPFQVRSLFETDDPLSMELALTPTTQELPKKRRRKDCQIHPDSLILWLKRQVCLHKDLHVDNLTYSFKDGLILCAIINKYRPDLLDFSKLDPIDVAGNNQRAFYILEKDFGIPPIMTGDEMAECNGPPDAFTMLTYLTQVYEAFRGEIPHTRIHTDNDIDKDNDEENNRVVQQQHNTRKRASPSHRNDPPSASRRPRKRRSTAADRPNFGGEERQQRLEEIEENRRDRYRRRKLMRDLQTEQLKKSLAMMEFNQWMPEEGDGFQDYSLYVYRQTASEFRDRVKDLEMKLLYPDKESRMRAELRNAKMSSEDAEQFSGRIKDIEEKLKGEQQRTQKKPRDLLRAIGKIEKTDWQVKEIEKKIEENKYGKASHDVQHTEKVPKWSRQQFADKFQIMEKKLLKKGLDQETASRYAEVDCSLKKLEQKLKEGSSLEIGRRGSNKVSAMAEQFAQRPEDKINIQKSSSKGLILPSQSTSEKCHFCDKRVYLMEKVNAEGKSFHRSCFKCEYCGTTLRVGSYMFDREGQYGYRFYCNQHFGLPGIRKSKQKQDKPKMNSPRGSSTRTPDKPQNPLVSKHLTPPGGPLDSLDRGATPERIEFENYAGDDLHKGTESEMDEDEWTDRNFGASVAEGSSGDNLDDSDVEDEEEEEDDDDEDEDEDEDEEALMTADEAREVAEKWTRKHSSRVSAYRDNYNEQDSCEADSEDDFSEDDGNHTVTEDEALELRKREVRLNPIQHAVTDTDTGSETEVASDEHSTSPAENSATEISTDSEFEHDGTTPTRQEMPDILLTDRNRRNRQTEEPRKVQVQSRHIGSSNLKQEQRGVELEFRPLVESSIIPSKPVPFVNPRRGDYLLNKTQSTEGIATKMSLELRKKYLLGTTTSNNNIAKSGSTTALDSKLKNFASSITECQKLLNPANEISPTMQAFLQTTSKPRMPTSPTITTPPLNLPPSSMIFRKKELPSLEKNFAHVCGKKSENAENADPNIQEKTGSVDSLECRPRSPAHETSIIVPQIPWSKSENKEIDDSESESTESESSSSSSANDNIEDGEGTAVGMESLMPPPPRLEVTEPPVEDEDVFELDSLQPVDDGHTALSMTEQMERAKEKIRELKESIAQGEADIKMAFEKSENTQKSDSAVEPEQVNEILAECVDKDDDDIKGDDYDDDEDSSPTFAALTETELSDWARDGGLVVSEALEDSLGSRNAKNAKGKSLDDKRDSFSHVCGKKRVDTNQIFDSLEFMDTGEVSELDSLTNTNQTGYSRLTNDDETALEHSGGKPPLALVENSSSSSSDPTTTSSSSTTSFAKRKGFGTTTEESTTSEQTTIKNCPDFVGNGVGVVYSQLIDKSTPTTPTSSAPLIEEKEEFDEYVHRLQGRISPFHNVWDSIDYRKSRQKSNDTDCSPTSPIAREVISEEKYSTGKKEEDTTSQKLREISRERNLQKDLVHEMVLKKVLATKKSPTDRKNKRIIRNNSAILSGPVKPPEVPITPDTKQQTSSRTNIVNSGASSISKCLPETPLTHPESFSPPMPDLTHNLFKTPSQVLQSNKEMEKARESARARARLKSDEELGLSPEDKIRAIREKAAKLLDTPIKKSQDSDFTPKRNIKTTFGISKSSSTSTVFDRLRGDRNSEVVGPKLCKKSTSDLVEACVTDEDRTRSPDSAGELSPTSSANKTQSRDRERRKSIIQAVSDFFHIKSPSSPTKSPSPTKTNPLFSAKFKLTTKTKENKKDGAVCNGTASDTPLSVSAAPPIPPPPIGYKPQNLLSEESGGSELEEPTMSSMSSISTIGMTAASADPTKRARMNKRMARQAQLKRLRMAHEIERRLDEVEETQRELEARGVALEKAIRGEEGVESGGEQQSSDLYRDWFEVIRERNHLRRLERELSMQRQQLQLEDRHAKLQQELRDRLAKDDSSKTPEELAEEGAILREMLETVDERDALQALLTSERQRYEEEDKEFEAQAQAKGLRLAPAVRHFYQSSV